MMDHQLLTFCLDDIQFEHVTKFVCRCKALHCVFGSLPGSSSVAYAIYFVALTEYVELLPWPLMFLPDDVW